MAKKIKFLDAEFFYDKKPLKKSTTLRRGLPVELLDELFAALPMTNAFGILARMPNLILARNVRKMLKRMKMAIKANKWNLEDCGPEMKISNNGLEVKYSGPAEWNCVRTVLPIPKLNLNAKTIFYFEVEILEKDPQWNYAIVIGFCDKQFPLEGEWLGNRKNSIGIWCKGAMRIDNLLCIIENGGGHFKAGDAIGLGIVHSPANSPKMKCFASWNGELLGMFELDEKFADLQLFPSVNLSANGDLIRANFGHQKWRFDPSSQLQ